MCVCVCVCVFSPSMSIMFCGSTSRSQKENCIQDTRSLVTTSLVTSLQPPPKKYPEQPLSPSTSIIFFLAALPITELPSPYNDGNCPLSHGNRGTSLKSNLPRVRNKMVTFLTYHAYTCVTTGLTICTRLHVSDMSPRLRCVWSVVGCVILDNAHGPRRRLQSTGKTSS